nr:MFS transporter [Paracidobacterium acidisoli]
MVGFATTFIYSFSLMMKSWQHDFGWNREQISQGFSLAAITVAICSPLMGKLLDRFEPRSLIAPCMAVFGLGMASLAFLTPSLTRYYATAVVIGVAGTGTYQLGYARIVASWFEHRLGIALSFVVAGSGLGSLFFPPLVEHLISVYGWRNTYLLLACLPLFLGAPLTWFFAPSSQAKHRAANKAQQAGEQAPGLGWKQGLASRSFWLIALGICCMSLAENGALAHLVPMLNDRGISARDAAFIVSILGGSSLAGRLLLGWMLDYLEGARIATGALLLAGSGIYLLGHARSFRAAAIAALIAGLGMGCEFDLIPYMLKRYFGMRSFSTIYGLTYSVYAVAGGTAPLLLGYIYDVTGSYTRILSIFSVITAVVAFAMLLLPAYRFAAPPATFSESLSLETEAAVESN